MPKSRVQTSPAALSPGQAVYVLERLVADRRVSQDEVNRYAAEIGREIRDLEARLYRLRIAGAGGTAGDAPPGGRARRGNGNAAEPAATPVRTRAAKKSRRTLRVTPEQIESRKLQGHYLSLIRRIPANKRPHYTKLASDKGREAAIREMKAVLGK